MPPTTDKNNQPLKDELEKIINDAASGNITGRNRTHRILIHHHATIETLANKGLSLAAAHRVFCKSVAEVSYNSMNNYIKQWLPDLHCKLTGRPPLKKETPQPTLNKAQQALFHVLKEIEGALSQDECVEYTLGQIARQLDDKSIYESGVSGALKKIDTVSGRLLIAAAKLCEKLDIERRDPILTKKVINNLYQNKAIGDIRLSFETTGRSDWLNIVISDCDRPLEYIKELALALNDYHPNTEDQPEDLLFYIISETRPGAIRDGCRVTIMPSAEIPDENAKHKIHIGIRDLNIDDLRKRTWIRASIDGLGLIEGWPETILATLLKRESAPTAND